MALSPEEIAAHAYKAGFRGRDLTTAVAVAMAESRGKADAVGDERLTNHKWGPSYGLWQVRSTRGQSGTGNARDGTKLRDPSFNAQSAYKISDGGSDFSAWTTYKNGDYQDFLGEASQAARNVRQNYSDIQGRKNAVRVDNPGTDASDGANRPETPDLSDKDLTEMDPAEIAGMIEAQDPLVAPEVDTSDQNVPDMEVPDYPTEPAPLGADTLSKLAQQRINANRNLAEAKAERDRRRQEATANFKQYQNQLQNKTENKLDTLANSASRKNLAFQPSYMGTGQRDIRNTQAQQLGKRANQFHNTLADLESKVAEARQKRDETIARIERVKGRKKGNSNLIRNR